jgi:Arc/MetJ-type ribon-helix-helix transcriptional regulator
MIHFSVYPEVGVMVRVNITFDRETLRLADREARRRKTSRSDFIRSAIRSAAEGNEQAVKEAARHERRRKAIEGMRRIAHKLGDWPAEQILHDMRLGLAGDRD